MKEYDYHAETVLMMSDHKPGIVVVSLYERITDGGTVTTKLIQSWSLPVTELTKE